MAKKLELIKNLKICHWNARRLAEKINELKIFIQEQKVDVMLIIETNLTSDKK